MSVERAEVTQEIRKLAAESGVELFRAYGVELEDAPDGWIETDALLLSGVMGFVEEHLSGTCVLAAPRDALMATAPAGARPRDWVGELTNQLVGRLKAKLMAQGFSPVGQCGGDFAALLRRQYDEYGRIIRETGIKAD